MQLSGWQISTLILGSLFLGSLITQGRLSSTANAAPADVVGSANIAVTGFETAGGYFMLWTDGHITTVPQTTGETVQVVNPSARTSGAYTDAPAYVTKPTPAKGQSSGSPHIAVGVVPAKGATYVLFADGSLRTPSSIDASRGQLSVRSAVLNGKTFSHESGDKGITFNGTGQVGEYWVYFNPPFKNVPAVTVSAEHECSSVPEVYREKCLVNTGRAFNVGFVKGNQRFSLTAVGD